MLQRCLVLILVAIASSLASAASPEEQDQHISIRGRVVDMDGFSLPNAPIEIGKKGKPERQVVAKTDIKGHYEVRGLEPADDYVISIDYAGFVPVEVGPLSVRAQEPVRQDITLRTEASATSVTIGRRWLDEEEKQLYLQTGSSTAEQIRTARFPTIGLIVGELERIDELPDWVREDARDALRGRIAEVLAEVVEPGDPILSELFRDPDPVIQSMAIHILYNQDNDAWLQDPELRALLQELLESPAENAEIVQGILMTYAFAGRFGEVRSTALALARSENIELSREAASVIAWNHEHEEDFAGLRNLFQESTGVLRQEAAIWLAEVNDEPFAPKERSAVAAELVRTMEDTSLSPDFRGDAIRGADWLSEEPIVHDALLGLLEPDEWFSGVPDACRPRHSLSVVLDSLDTQAGIEVELLALKDRLDLLEEEYRSEVKGAIDRILTKLPPVVE